MQDELPRRVAVEKEARCDSPLVSIVTPVFNGGRFLEQCIESSLAQTYSHWEHVIVDNCSTDETAAIAARFARSDARIRVFRNPSTVGALQNHNVAVGKVSTDTAYVKLLHADDRLLPTCLEQMVAVAEASPSVGIVGSYAYSQSTVVCRGLPEDTVCFPGRDIGRRTLLGETYPFWSPSCLLHRIATVKERPHFYNENDFHADVQSSYEILMKWDFGFVHEPLMVIGAHADSRTSTLAHPMKKLIATNLDLLATYGPTFLTSDELAARFDQHIEHYYKVLAESALELKGPEFWRFHREALAKAGRPFSTSRLLNAVASEVTSRPRRSCSRLIRRLVGS